MWEWILKYWVEWLFGTIIAAGAFVLKKTIKRQKAIENGIRDTLRILILDNYEKCKQEGKISVSRKDAIDSAYNSYHALGGNGTITQVHNEIMGMAIQN